MLSPGRAKESGSAGGHCRPDGAGSSQLFLPGSHDHWLTTAAPAGAKKKGIIMQQTSQRRVPARRRKLSLECKLAAYALATGAILATPDQAPADIIYSGVVDQPVGYNTSFNIDLNGDGTTDFTIITSQILYVQAPGNNAVVITPPDAAAALNPFDEISANDQLGRGRRLMAFYTGGGTGPSGTRPSGGPWLGAQNKFLGLRFNFPDGSTHYGWARLSVGFD
jgi:hypothetical protein